jgi:hypothetical protein
MLAPFLNNIVTQRNRFESLRYKVLETEVASILHSKSKIEKQKSGSKEATEAPPDALGQGEHEALAFPKYCPTISPCSAYPGMFEIISAPTPARSPRILHQFFFGIVILNLKAGQHVFDSVSESSWTGQLILPSFH